ncbi:unnamed protein product, partial [Rangifer tarandus platyrhynchus]
VEAVEEGAALEGGEVSGIGQDVQLLVLDVMEEVEVVVYEEQQQVSSEEQGQELARPGTPSDRPALEALAALQLELEPDGAATEDTVVREEKTQTSPREAPHSWGRRSSQCKGPGIGPDLVNRWDGGPRCGEREPRKPTLLQSSGDFKFKILSTTLKKN